MEYTYIHNHQSQFLEMFGNLDKTERLSDHCQVISGKSMSVKEEESSGPIPYIKVADFNIAGNDKFIATSSRYVSVESASKSKMIQKGCVVFAKNGAASLSNKKRLTAIECCIDMNTMAVKINDDSLSSEYLYFFLCSIDIKDHVRQGAIPSIDPHSVESILLPLPPMDQQKTFVTIAEQADKSKFDGFKSQFLELFGNPVTNPMGWPTERIDIVAPESPSKEDLPDSTWVLNLDMIESNTGQIISKQRLNADKTLSVLPFDEGNVLFSKLRPYLNKVVLPDEKGLATTELVPLRPNPAKLSKVFFTYLLRSDQFVQFANDIAGGTKMPRMPLSELRKFQCILPPIESQLQFESIVDQADKSKYYEINET